MRFDFGSPVRILFAPGAVREIPAIANEYGKRVLLVTGGSPDRFPGVRNGLERDGFAVEVFAIRGEPTIAEAREGACLAKALERDVVIAIGGGSAIDAAKAIAILATNPGEPLDYIEVVGKGKAFEHAPLPFIAIPTTAGTGAEVTRNAVLDSPEHGLKASLRHSSMMAKVAVVDPELTFDLPPGVTASTGLDALTQLIEPFVSSRSNPFVDVFCLEGMKRVRTSLIRAFQNGRDPSAREDMSFASLLGGLSLANAGLGVVHGFASPLGGMLHAPHGALCAAVLPWGVRINIEALRNRAPSHPALQKYAQAARIVTGQSHAGAEDLAPWLADMLQKLNVKPLHEHGLDAQQIPPVVQKAAQASSMKANPIPLTSEELREIAERAL